MIPNRTEAFRAHVSVRLDADRWATRRVRRRVLAVVHTVTAGQRLMDAVRLLEGDARLQVFFTAAPDVFNHGVAELLDRLKGLVLPWHQAVQTEFDLALAASHGGLHELQAPVVVLPHGAGHNKLVAPKAGARAAGARDVYGLGRQRLVHDGVVVPEALVLAHHEELGRLGRVCPEAVPAAAVIGDACYDRLAASKNSRALYRQTLGAGHRHRLVLVCSTWGPASLLGQDWDLLEGLVGGLPGDEYRVALLLHPNVWSTYGEWQIRGWLAGLGRRGLTVVGQDADWTGVMAAADYVVGDHGSVPLYGMLAGVPVLVTEAQESGVDPGSPMAELRSLAPRLRTDRLYPSQLRRSHAAYTPHTYERLASRITSEPGRFARNMRALMYQKLRMRPPAGHPVTEPAPLPTPLWPGRNGDQR
ncbi:hypothetical protein [Streptomyces sp. PLM4]|uniref:hypothetical protein n=1 Tax=Streptomyces sp. PLM4 TaxID=2929798 RepID=UPI002054BD79|nr:hypothetical protein [Streptomyces sp. PLM4]BDH72533.1 hypothetical protein MTP06_59820 [Streptomyces sp. PLM4]